VRFRRVTFLLVCCLAAACGPVLESGGRLRVERVELHPPGSERRLRPVRVEVEAPPRVVRLPRVGAFTAMDLPLGQALEMLVQPYGYTLDCDGEVDLGRRVSMVRIRDLNLDRAVERLLAGTGYWSGVDPEAMVVRVRARVTRTWRLPLLNLAEKATVDLVAGGDTLGSEAASSTLQAGGRSTADMEQGLRVRTESTVGDPWKDIRESIAGFLSREGRVLVDRLSGTVTVTDRPRIVEAVDRFLSQVARAVSRQVELEVTVIEVLLSRRFQLGVDWDKVAGAVGGGWRTSFGLVGLPLSARDMAPASGAARLMVGRGDVSAVIGALQAFGRVRIVARPRLRVVNNATAQLFVGESTPYLAKYQNITAGGSYERLVETGQVRTGIALSVTPAVGEDGSVRLSITPTLSDLVGIETFRPFEEIQVSRPRVSVREMRTQVVLRSGETVVMGGLIYDYLRKDGRGLPGLIDVPGLGALFGTQGEEGRRVELVVSIHPRVVEAGS